MPTLYQFYKSLRYSLWLLIVCLCPMPVGAQTSPQPSYTLNDNQTGTTKNYVARDNVTLKPGFSYKAESGGKSFQAKIDAGLLFIPESVTNTTYKMTDGSFTSDPTQGAVVGSIPGSFAVSPTGAATYTIPIEVPAGINGMQPNISLTYNSQGGNGIAGWGWNISGISAISRTGSNLYNDSKVASVSLSTADNLLLDGQRLILVEGAHFVNGARYRTEIETYSNVVYKTINGYQCFEVQTKEGVLMEFGASTDSYIEAQGSSIPLTWLLTKVTDTNGNYMTYSYGEDNANGEFWLSKINYTGNVAAGVSPVSEIEFVYDGNRIDSNTTYVAGSKINQSKLLKQIITRTNAYNLRNYTLTYNNDSYYLKLLEINLVSYNGEKYNQTLFSWSDINNPSPNFETTSYTSQLGSLYSYSLDKTLIFADFNNDGFADLLRPNVDVLGYSNPYTGWQIFKSINNGKNFELHQTENYNNSNLFPFNGNYQMILTDANNDKKSDIIEIRKTTRNSDFKSYSDYTIDGLLNVNGYLERQNFNYQYTCESSVNVEFESGDFDANDEVELLFKQTNDFNLGEIKRYSIDLLNKTFTLKDLTNLNVELKKTRTTDINGNGLPEIFIPWSSKFFEYNSSVNSFAEISTSENFSSILYNVDFSDFNGDGKTDVVLYNLVNGTWKLKISTGNNFQEIPIPITRIRTKDSYTSENYNDQYLFSDYNGDGKSDIAEIYTAGSDKIVNIYFFNGKSFIREGFSKQSALKIHDNKMFPYVDVTGDGKCDFIGVEFDKITIISIKNEEANRAIASITNGFGQTNSITYKNISDNTVYTNGTSALTSQVVRLCVPIQVVSSVNSGVTNKQFVTNYNYKGLRIHTQGKGLLGFEEFVQDEVTTNKKIVSQFGYNSTYFNTYLTQQTASTSIGNSPISTTTLTNSIIPLGGKRIFSYISFQSTVDSLIGLSTTTESLNYDAYGNPQTIIKTKGTLPSSKIVETSTGTYIQAGSWCPNKVKSISTSKLVNGQTATHTSKFSFDSKGNILTEIMDSADVNSVTTSYQDYDNFGRCTLITKTANGLSRSTSSTYLSSINPSGRFISSKTNSLGEITYYKWDETKGQLISETNRIGTTTYKYNGFGSILETKYPDGIRKAQVYQWASPDNTIDAKYYTYSEASGTAPVFKWYDGLGNEILQETYGLNKNKISTTTEYYANGKVYRISEPYFDEDFNSKTWANIYSYDSYGRLLTHTTPIGVSTTTYDGLTTNVASPDGNSEVTLNDAGQMIGSKINGKTVSYTYYPSGLTKTSTPQGGQSITMEYNTQEKRTKLIDPDGGTVETKYNGFGELVEEKQKVHNATNYITTTKNYATNGLPQNIVRNGETTSYTYDTYNRVSTIEITGKNKQTFTYDSFDRKINVKEEIGTKVFNTAKVYDALGRVRKDIYPSGVYTKNFYDTYGNLVEVKDHVDRPIWKANAENARRQLTSIYKGTKETIFGFDSRGLPTSIVASGVEDMTYSFNSKGNLFYRTDNLTNQKEQFAYDGMNRLTNWDVYQNGALVKQNGHVFDAATGNITSRSDLNSLTMTYGGNRADGTPIGPHALTSISGVPASFPAANLNITYTDFKKVASISEGSKEYVLSYGVDEQRRKSEYKVNQQTQLTRYYLGGYEEEIDALGNIRKIHYLSGGALLIQNNGVESLLFGYSDFQGSLIALTDENGTVIEKYAYDPWGVRRNPNDWTQKDTRTNWITNRGYTGHEHIDAFGVINMNGRVYDPATGMFLSPDPYLQAPKDWLNYNRYSYCMGNPFKYTDPSGKFFKFIGGLVGIIMDIVSIPVKLVASLVGTIAGDKGIWKEMWGKGSWSTTSMWKGGENVDNWIFGKEDPNRSTTTGQPGFTNGTSYLTSDNNTYYRYNDLKSMVDFMTKKSEELDVEIAAFVLSDDKGNEYFYVLDWSGNTNSTSNIDYNIDYKTKRATFDGKNIMAQIHTHPASYYTDPKHQYDGSSYKDYHASQGMKGVPVYSIGPTTVSVISAFSSQALSESAFYKIAEGKYKDVYAGGVKIGINCDSNPYFYKLTSEWLLNPTLPYLLK